MQRHEAANSNQLIKLFHEVGSVWIMLQRTRSGCLLMYANSIFALTNLLVPEISRTNQINRLPRLSIRTRMSASPG